MAVPQATLATVPYNIGAPQVLTDITPLRGEHKLYTTGNARITDAWAPNNLGPQMRDFTGTINAGGNTIYLPYNDDRITSVRLPVPAPGGVNFFLTANMSGCKFFVDTINGSNDLIVYHANTHQHGAPAHNTAANFQSPAAGALLNTMHANAQGDYAPLVLNNVASLGKPAYYQQAALLEQRKTNQGRHLNLVNPAAQVTPEFCGGCSVMGFYAGGAWHFYFQTWGDVDYDRPSGVGTVAKDLLTFRWNSVHKLRTQGTRHAAAYANFSVVAHGLIW